MTYPHARRSHAVQALALAIVSSLALPCNADQQAVLTVVEDRGGSSALSYYQDIDPEPTHTTQL